MSSGKTLTVFSRMRVAKKNKAPFIPSPLTTENYSAMERPEKALAPYLTIEAFADISGLSKSVVQDLVAKKLITFVLADTMEDVRIEWRRSLRNLGKLEHRPIAVARSSVSLIKSA
jgi:hypothetical protein